MSDAADFARQLAAEDRTKQRHYVLASTRRRWRVLGLGVVLLTAVRVAGLVPIAWSFILGFPVLFAAVDYAMARVARAEELPPWYTHATLAVGAALISAIVYAVGPTGHLLYVAYLIAPLQAALTLGRNEAWHALVLNLTGFALVTMLARIVARLRTPRTTLARLEAGDLTVRVPDDAPDELGYLGVSVNRTTDGIAAIARQVQHQGQDLAAMAQQLSASAHQLQAASQGISTTTRGPPRGAERQP